MLRLVDSFGRTLALALMGRRDDVAHVAEHAHAVAFTSTGY